MASIEFFTFRKTINWKKTVCSFSCAVPLCSDNGHIFLVSHLICIHIFTQPNDEQYISLERQSIVEALCELLSLQFYFLPMKFCIGMLRNFNAIFLNKMFFADEQSLI